MSALLFLVSVALELRGREGHEMGHGRGTSTSVEGAARARTAHGQR
jgi:hypothetical protein